MHPAPVNHKPFKILIVIAFFWSSTMAIAQIQPQIIPLPASYELNNGTFSLTDASTIFTTDEALTDELYYFQTELLRRKGMTISRGKDSQSDILLQLDPNQTEGYSLQIQPNQIIISAAKEEGIFHGLISVLQLAEASAVEEGKINILCWTLQDAALFGWRGYMLDESRHFFGKETVKKLLDWMAFYKLNTFHWHLTDAPGWRIEIKEYPRLALVGGIGNQSNPNLDSEYYSQEDIKEIVRYAAERKITIIPEIDMPGHATAANMAYPEYSGGGSEKYPEFTFHPAKEGTYQYLTTILKEVNSLFPSGMIHLGGDEVSFGNEGWKSDPEVKSLMQRESLPNLKAVENYFMQRMADSLFAMNSTLLAWDEMADAGLPSDKTLLMWWRHDQPKQLQLVLDNNIPTILCPRIPLYFDFVQQEQDQYGRKWAGAFSPLEQVYAFSMEKLGIAKPQQHLIKGLQANLWTETVHNEERLDYLTFPRIAAMAEAAWTAVPQRNYEEFLIRLSGHTLLYERADLYYFDPKDPASTPEPVFKP